MESRERVIRALSEFFIPGYKFRKYTKKLRQVKGINKVEEDIYFARDSNQKCLIN
jgi:hypothetical protein